MNSNLNQIEDVMKISRAPREGFLGLMATAVIIFQLFYLQCKVNNINTLRVTIDNAIKPAENKKML